MLSVSDISQIQIAPEYQASPVMKLPDCLFVERSVIEVAALSLKPLSDDRTLLLP